MNSHIDPVPRSAPILPGAPTNGHTIRFAVPLPPAPSDQLERLEQRLAGIKVVLDRAADTALLQADQRRRELAAIIGQLAADEGDLKVLKHTGWGISGRADSAATFEAAAESYRYLSRCIGCALRRNELPTAPPTIRETPIGVAKSLQHRDRAIRSSTVVAYVFRCVGRLPLPHTERAAVYAALLAGR